MILIVILSLIQLNLSCFYCPAPNGMFPHPDCSKFFHCSNGIPYVKDCAAGPLEFQPTGFGNGICNWASQVQRHDCFPRGIPTYPTTHYPDYTSYEYSTEKCIPDGHPCYNSDQCCGLSICASRRKVCEPIDG